MLSDVQKRENTLINSWRGVRRSVTHVLQLTKNELTYLLVFVTLQTADMTLRLKSKASYSGADLMCTVY